MSKRNSFESNVLSNLLHERPLPQSSRESPGFHVPSYFRVGWRLLTCLQTQRPDTVPDQPEALVISPKFFRWISVTRVLTPMHGTVPGFSTTKVTLPDGDQGQLLTLRMIRWLLICDIWCQWVKLQFMFLLALLLAFLQARCVRINYLGKRYTGN